MTTWLKSNKREYKDIKDLFSKSDISNNINDIKLIGFLQKQSNRSLPNSNVKIYKKKWFWFDNETGVLYYTNQQCNSNNSENNNNNSVSIKSIIIGLGTIIEQSKSFRLDFTITNEKVNKHYILRSTDEQTVLKWVNSLNSWKKYQQQKIEQERQQSLLEQQSQLEIEEQSRLENLQNQETCKIKNNDNSNQQPIPFVDFINKVSIETVDNDTNKKSNDSDKMNEDDVELDDEKSKSTVLTNSTSSTLFDSSTSPSYTPPSTSPSSDISSLIGSPIKTTENSLHLPHAFEKQTSFQSLRTTQQDLQLFLKSLFKFDTDISNVPNKIQDLFFQYPSLLYQEQISYVQERLQSQINYFNACLKDISYLNNPMDNDNLDKNNGEDTKIIEESNLENESIYPKGSLTESIENSLINDYIDESGEEDNEEEIENNYEEFEGVMDIFLLLPNHLSLYIFSYLEPNELLLCAQVSQQWKVLSEDNLLWIRFVFHLMTPSSIFDTTHKWKQVYLDHYSPKLKKTTKEHYMSRSITCSTSSSLALASSIIKEGWLFKRGEDILKIWKKRYFVLKPDSLFYFKHPNDNIPCGMILFNSKTHITRSTNASRKHSFKIVQPKFQTHHGIERKRVPYYLSADKESDCQDWMNILLKIIKANNIKLSNNSSNSSILFKNIVIANDQYEHNKPQNTKNKKNNCNSNSIDQQNNFNGSGSFSKPNSLTNSINSTPSSPSSPNLGHKSKEINQIPVNPIFGLPITILMENQKNLIGENIELPWILHVCFNYIIQFGLTEVGIFRLSGSVREINKLQEEFEGSNPKEINLKSYDIHSVTNLVKTFFRKLPNSLISTDLDEYATTVQLASSQTEEEKIGEFKFIFESLDKISYRILKSLLNLLVLIIKNESVNKMTMENLLIVIMPNLKCSPILITNGIKFYDQLFK